MVRAFRTAILAASLPVLVPAAAATTTASATATTPNAVCHPVHRHHAVHVKTVVVHHADAGLGVTIDQARIVAFPKPVKTVFVGNPTVVDVSMIDSQHAFLLGKTFGVTNMIALAADGNQISNQQVTVLNNGAAVTINRGADQFNYMCTLAHCETAPRPGDPAPYVGNTESTATSHAATASAVGTNVQAQQAASN